MTTHTYNIFKSHIELVNKIISYFLAEASDLKKFEEIKQNAVENNAKSNKLNQDGIIHMGYFSAFNFLMYLTDKNEAQNGINSAVLDSFLQILSDEKVLTQLPDNFGIVEKRYKANGDFAKFLYERDLILNVICGWGYIIDKYTDSVVKIQHIDKKGDIHIGTGFYLSEIGEKPISLIVTNKHVLENATEIKVFTKDDVEVEFIETKLDDKSDLGFVILKSSIERPSFHFDPSVEILSEILTIGYPSIPMTNSSYQVCHKGEVNSMVQDYYNNNLFLFSAKTSSGNSGSPIINRFGMVIGIVTEELFEKDKFYEKGKLPYYAGISSEEIVNALKKII